MRPDKLYPVVIMVLFVGLVIGIVLVRTNLRAHEVEIDSLRGRVENLEFLAIYNDQVPKSPQASRQNQI